MGHKGYEKIQGLASLGFRAHKNATLKRQKEPCSPPPPQVAFHIYIIIICILMYWSQWSKNSLKCTIVIFGLQAATVAYAMKECEDLSGCTPADCEDLHSAIHDCTGTVHRDDEKEFHKDVQAAGDCALKE